MFDLKLVTTFVQMFTFSIAILFAIAYALLILCIRRFRTVHNIFRLNACLASITSNSFFLSFFVLLYYDATRFIDSNFCLVVYYFYMVCPLQVPLACVSFSIHRFCLIFYHSKIFFKRQRWALLCLSLQWILGLLIPIPFLLRSQPVSYNL